MGLYVEVRKSEDGLPITNATFWYSFINYGNGVYFVFAPFNTTIYVAAPGRNTRYFNTGTYVKYFIWLSKYVPHSKSHSSGGWT
jgi:hypothetical protein